MSERTTPLHRLFTVPPAPTFGTPPAGPIPNCQFRIERHHAHANMEKLPSLRAMAFHMNDGFGSAALGFFFGDVALKLLRPFPVYGRDLFAADPNQTLILNIADGLLPYSPAASVTRTAFLSRLGEFLEIALNQPGRLPAIISNIDALTNVRLTERARTILMTGRDPGADDLWPACECPLCNDQEAAGHEH
jgi:hypothetical protein